MTTRHKESKHDQDITQTSQLSIRPENTDIFAVVHSHSSNQKLSPEQRKEKFVSKRTRSLKDIFLRRRPSEKAINIEPKSNQPTKTKIATLISKHFLPLRGSSLRTGRYFNSKDAASCPNITDRLKTSPKRTKRYSDIPIVEIKRTENSSTQLSVDEVSDDCFEDDKTDPTKIFSAPVVEKKESKSPSSSSIEVFTTSFTHSVPKKTAQDPLVKDSLPIYLFPKDHSRSAQELQKSPILVLKQRLVRSYSDTPPTKSLLYRKQRQYLTLDTFRQSKMYKGDNCSQLLDYLFIGSVEAAYNQPLLCKLKIDSIVDISNVPAADVPASKKALCPCLCTEQFRHFRSRLIINIDDDEQEDISQYFAEINKFIDGVRQRNKKVLIFSYNGISRAPAAAIQYLMSHENFLLRQAFNLVKNQRPSMLINQGFQKTLETLEHTLFPDEIPSVQFGNEYLNIADPQAIKCAWVDCSDM